MTRAAQDEQPDDTAERDQPVTEDGKTEADLWGEFDAAEGVASSAPADGKDVSANDDEPAGDTNEAAPAAAKDAPPGEQPPGEKPAAAAADTTDFDKLLSTAPPELKAAYEKLQQSDRSNRGRVSALQRQIDELTARAEKPAAASKGEAADGSKANGADSGFLDSPKWKSFHEDYPDVAGPLGEVVSALQAELRDTKKRLDAHDNVRQQDAVVEQVQLLEQQHPDWQDVTAVPEFASWLDDQPRYIREAVQRNAKAIVDAAEAADILSRFKATRSGQNHAQQENRSNASNGARSGTTGSLSGKRQRQLESASAARSRGPGAAHGIPEDGDEEALWRAFDEQERRAAQA